MHTVFHVSTPDAFEVAEAKVRNLLADDTLHLDSVAVLVDDGETVDRLATDLAGTAEAIVDAPADLKVCFNALRGATVDAEALPSDTEVVSSGVGELTRLQHDGAAYIRI